MLHNFHGLEDTTSSWAPDEFVFSPQVCLLSFFLGSAAGVACPCAPVHAAFDPHLFTPPTLVLLLLGFLSPWLYSSPPPEAVISVVCCMPCMNHFLLRCLGGEGDSV